MYTLHLLTKYTALKCSRIVVGGRFIVNVIQRIRQLNQERDWTDYRLAKEAGLSQSTISNLTARGNSPTLFTLERICRAYGMSLSQFFCGCDGTEDIDSAQELQQLCSLYQRLSKYQRKDAIRYIRSLLWSSTQKKNQ